MIFRDSILIASNIINLMVQSKPGAVLPFGSGDFVIDWCVSKVSKPLRRIVQSAPIIVCPLLLSYSGQCHLAPDKIRSDHQHILDTIHQELQKLDKKLGDQSQKIERLEKEHSRMIFELQTQLLEARKKETEALEKYISLCENVQRGQYEIRENGLDK